MSTAQIPPHDPPPELTAEWVDKAVATGRSLCQQFSLRELPDPSALRGLLSFAQTTPSPAEAVLFVRYQATRLTKSQRFLQQLATTLEQEYSGDIGQLRRFLGVVVRAGIVQRKQHQLTPAGRGQGERRPPPRTAGTQPSPPPRPSGQGRGAP